LSSSPSCGHFPLLVSFPLYATCTLDAPEIGDIGPDSQRVCEQLASQSPQSDIAILDRRIHSPEAVSVMVSVDGQRQSLEYVLRGADWRRTQSVAQVR